MEKEEFSLQSDTVFKAMQQKDAVPEEVRKYLSEVIRSELEELKVIADHLEETFGELQMACRLRGSILHIEKSLEVVNM